MTIPTHETAGGWFGRPVHDREGTPLGTCAGSFTDDPTGEVEWLDVELADGSRVVVPVDGATEVAGSVRVALLAAQVRSAPGTSARQHLEVEDEERLRAHYGDAATVRARSGAARLLPALGAAAAAGTGVKNKFNTKLNLYFNQ